MEVLELAQPEKNETIRSCTGLRTLKSVELINMHATHASKYLRHTRGKKPVGLPACFALILAKMLPFSFSF